MTSQAMWLTRRYDEDDRVQRYPAGPMHRLRVHGLGSFREAQEAMLKMANSVPDCTALICTKADQAGSVIEVSPCCVPKGRLNIELEFDQWSRP